MNYQPNRWSCLLYAWSYNIAWEPWTLIKALGHDGSEIKWPHLPEPYRRRGFHPQELIYLGDRFGFVTTMYEPLPVLISSDPKYPITIDYSNQFQEVIKNSNGVFLGQTKHGSRHAIAWINDQVLDPDQGMIKSLDDFNIQIFFRIKSKWWQKRFDYE